MTKMTKAEKKAEKAKIKAMSFKEKREYYKSKRIGWRKAWYIIKWILAGFAAFVVTCLIIMIVQLNTESKTITKAVHKAEAKATATTKTPTPTTAKSNPVDKSGIVVLVEQKKNGVWQEVKTVETIHAKKKTDETAAVDGHGTFRNTYMIYNEKGDMVERTVDTPYNQ